MDAASQFSFKSSHGRSGSQSTNNDRQLSESSNPSSSFNHPRQNNQSSVSVVGPSRQTFNNRQNSTPSEQRSTDPSAQFQKPVSLHFDYHSRYPSPSTTQRSPNSLSSSPPLHPSPNLHRTNGSSSASSLSMITLPPLSAVAHPHRVVDQSPNHQHVDLSSLPPIQRKPPSITQLPRNHPEQGSLRRHTLDSGDPQIVSGGRKRTLSTLPSPIPRGKPRQGSQQVPPPPPQPGQPNKPTSSRYSSPPPPSNSRRENPPPLAMSPNPMSPSMSQPLQISQPSQDGSSSITSADEAADAALEPLRFGFENIWADTVQNVRQIMGKMQNDLSRLNAAEGRKNVNLMRCLVSTSEKLKSQEWAVDELRKENSSLVQKALENEQLRRENNQKRTMMDALNQENHNLRRENEELRKKNEEVKEALTKAAEFLFQYKEELAKVKADAETFRKCREASVLSANDQTVPVATTDLHREITRLHAEKERERIFNDAVKQLRALTTLEGTATTREHDSEEMDVETAFTKADDRRTGSFPSEVSKIPSPLPNCIIDEQPRQSTPPSATTQVESTDKEEKCKVEVDDHEMDVEMNEDDEDVTIVPPITTTIPNSVGKPDAEQDIQLMDESRIFKEEQELLSDLEMQRQRQRQALRGPTTPSSSSPLQARSRKSSLGVSKTGVKRDREEYEDGQVDEDGYDHDVGIDEPGIVLEENPMNSPVQDRTETQGIVADAEADADDNSEGKEEEEIVILERELKDDVPKRQKDKKVSTDGRQVMPQMEIKKVPALSTGKVLNPKALGKRSHYRDFISPPTSLRSFVTTTQQPPPSPQPRLPKKLGINHMDLLYKTEREVMVCRICLSLEQNVEATTAERRKLKANTQKFPLNASWADLINHCQTEHTKACEDMEKLSPSQLAEMKQRTR